VYISIDNYNNILIENLIGKGRHRQTVLPHRKEARIIHIRMQAQAVSASREVLEVSHREPNNRTCIKTGPEEDVLKYSSKTNGEVMT
jgi:hypothetical protein